MLKNIKPKYIQDVFENSRIIKTAEDLTRSFDVVAENITADLKKENPIVVSLMNGGVFITCEIMKRLCFPLQYDYIDVRRYNNNYKGNLKVTWSKSPNIDPRNRTVILFDDILDGGITLSVVKKYYEGKGAKKTLTAVMFDKNTPREIGGLENADYVGLQVENEFLFGFGLDYHGYLRNVPSINAVSKKYMI